MQFNAIFTTIIAFGLISCNSQEKDTMNKESFMYNAMQSYNAPVADKNEKLLVSKDEQIKLLEDEILKFQKKIYPISEIEKELKIQYPDLVSFAMGDMVTSEQDTVCHAKVTLSKKYYSKDKNKITEWLRVRSDVDSLIVIFQ